MPEETGAGPERDDYFTRRLERLEQRLEREQRWWRGGLIGVLAFLAFSILIAGHHRHRRPPFAPWMACYGRFGAPPPPWGWGPPYGGGSFGWGQQWGGSRQPNPPPPPEVPNR